MIGESRYAYEPLETSRTSVLVWGAGMIGRAIVRNAAREHPTAVVDVDPRVVDLLPCGIQVYSPQEAHANKMTTQVDVLVWAAGVLSPEMARDESAAEAAELDFAHQLTLWEASPPRRLVLISSLAVYGALRGASEAAPLRPTTPYGIHKARLERIARSWAEQHDTELTVVRSCGVVGPVREPGGGWMQTALREFIRGGARDQEKLQPIRGQEILHADDLACAVMHVVNRAAPAPEILNVGSGVVLQELPGQDPPPGLDWTRARQILNYRPQYGTLREIIQIMMRGQGTKSTKMGRTSERPRRRTMVLAGSHRLGAYSTALAQTVAARLAAEGQDVDLIEVASLDLPLHNPDDHRDPMSSTDSRVRSFALRVQEANSFVWVTPIYHGSYSSGFKNAIDNVNISLMQDKPIAVMAHGGGRFGGSVLDHLRVIGVNLHARVINTAVATNNTDFAETHEGPKLTSEIILARIDRAVTELLIAVTWTIT